MAPMEKSALVEVVLISLKDHKLNCKVSFRFKASNNITEYEALFTKLKLAKEMQVKRLVNSSYSQLVVSQVNGNFTARDRGVAAYLKLVKDLLSYFKNFELT